MSATLRCRKSSLSSSGVSGRSESVGVLLTTTQKSLLSADRLLPIIGQSEIPEASSLFLSALLNSGPLMFIGQLRPTASRSEGAAADDVTVSRMQVDPSRPVIGHCRCSVLSFPLLLFSIECCPS